MLNFSSGVKSVSFTIPLISDDTPEDSAVISVALTQPENNLAPAYTVSRTQNTGEVEAIDSHTVPTLSIADAEGTETDTGTGTVVFDVTLMPAASEESFLLSLFTLSIASEGHTATSGR